MKDWSRYEEARALRDSGLSLKAVGQRLGISGSRVASMLRQLARKQAQDAREAADPSLVPWDRGLSGRARFALMRAGIESPEACAWLAADLLQVHKGAVMMPGWKEVKDDARLLDRKRLTMGVVNEVRAFLGVAPYVHVHTQESKAATDKQIQRAKLLLERNGWRVLPRDS